MAEEGPATENLFDMAWLEMWRWGGCKACGTVSDELRMTSARGTALVKDIPSDRTENKRSFRRQRRCSNFPCYIFPFREFFVLSGGFGGEKPTALWDVTFFPLFPLLSDLYFLFTPRACLLCLRYTVYSHCGYEINWV
jgi:hypothetical protein